MFSSLVNVSLFQIYQKVRAGVREMGLLLGFATLTAVGAKIKLEIGVVPITFQTLFVILSGAFLGSRKGALSQLIYLLMGVMGIPWFSRGGGIGYIFSPTFGYIVGFVLGAFVVGWFFEKNFFPSFPNTLLAFFVGNFILYLPGLLWLGKFVGWERVLMIGFYPFVLGDLLKIFLASLFILGREFLKVEKNKNLSS